MYATMEDQWLKKKHLKQSKWFNFTIQNEIFTDITDFDNEYKSTPAS